MKTKWLIKTVEKTLWRAPAKGARAELALYAGKFVAETALTPGAVREEVHVSFWAPHRGAVARMLKALALGPLSAQELIAEMDRVQP